MKSHKARPIWVGDFETTTDRDDCRVWGFGLARLDGRVFRSGHTINEFFEMINEESSIIYFHNLKFDGTFIQDYLFTTGFAHVDGPRDLEPRTFTTLISDKGRFYTITVQWDDGVRTEFRDSLNKINLSVAEIARSYGGDMTKGDIDYHKPRPVGYVMTDEERDYIKRDVLIVAHALSIVHGQGMTRLTVGSDALHEFRGLIGKSWQNLFPVLSLGLDADIRAAYRGGWTYADPRFSRAPQGAGHVFDVNSLYPSVMLNADMPYGMPEYCDGIVEPTKARPLTVQSITFTARIKPEHLPCIQVKNSSLFYAAEYQSNIAEPITMAVTNIDLALFHEHYDMDILAYNGGYRFAATRGLFDGYIGKWGEIKRNAKGGLREASKLYLNALYGKFATNPLVRGKVPYYTDRVKYEVGPDDQRVPVYTPLGVFITSYARDITIRAAQEHYDAFAYADTDSLHLLGATMPTTLDIDRNRFGAWKHEYAFTRALYMRSKAYIEDLVDGSTVVRIAGLPERAREGLRIDDVRPGMVIDGKLRPMNVPGGQVLTDVQFTLDY